MEEDKIKESFENFNLCIEGLQREVQELREFNKYQDKRIISLERWVENRLANEKRMHDELKIKQKLRGENR